MAGRRMARKKKEEEQETPVPKKVRCDLILISELLLDCR